MKIGVLRETTQGERRVALVPDAIAKLIAASRGILPVQGVKALDRALAFFCRSEGTFAPFVGINAGRGLR